ncbi:hypothetical protein D3C84_872570 [compost metagenome]
MGADVLDLQGAADQRAQRRVDMYALRHVQLGFAEVADAWRETEAQQVHQREDMIGEAGRVGVVFLDPQVRLVVQQTVEHIGRVTHADIHHAGAERCVLVGDMGVEQPPRLAAVLRVDVPGAFAPAARAEALAIGRRGRAVAPVSGEGMTVLVVDQLGQGRRVGFVSDVPGLQPGQLGVGQAGARLGHLGQPEVDRITQDR